jgi:alkanesulfonate monooxygenase SsuD/methylene tetrahydromethanopterin reductase-like flavin-dependent oxidoreductase (luciferase family)
VTVIGFHTSHEQVHPRQLLRDVRHAQAAGFGAAMPSDHFSPWSTRQYHPAIVAQAIATLSAMFPGRCWLWTLPDEPAHLVGAGVTVPTDRAVAAWADGLITVSQPVPVLRELVEAYRDAGGRGRLRLQMHLARAPDEADALAMAHDQWRSNVFGPPTCREIDSVETFDAVSDDVPPARVREVVRVSASLARHAEWLAELAGLGFDELYLHHVGQDQAAFMDAFGEHVLPQLTAPATNR